MSKHTKGPWKVGKMGIVLAEVGKAGVRGEGWAVAEARADDDMVKSGERDANARLIAAAPQLLEACRLAVANMCDHDARDCTCNAAGADPRCPRHGTRDAIRDAVCAATGLWPD